ncbi:MAG: tetraacyldisaccharide 4'-kinase [Paludibacteraceae bacterium]
MSLISRNILTRILSIAYGAIMEIRNFLFRKKIFSTTSFQTPIISIGNLAVGGTGKTPHTEYIIRLLKDDYNIAILSRGYGRKTTGFLQADTTTTATEIGDEPFQIYTKFPDIFVFVDEKRVRGVTKILASHPEIEVILLDDAYQHQYIKPGLSVLLTDYIQPYARDFVMPYGRLRERRKNSDRAHVIIVSKCPPDMTDEEKQMLITEIRIKKQQDVFFSGLVYDNFYPAFNECKVEIEQLCDTDVVVLTCIENPQPMIKYVEKLVKSIEKFTFADHHRFTKKELDKIEKKSYGKVIVTTEKDLARLKSIGDISVVLKEKLLVLPMRVKILNHREDSFNLKLKSYVRENSRNS